MRSTIRAGAALRSLAPVCAAVLVLALASCARTARDLPVDGGGGTEARGLVLRIETAGGFLPFEHLVRRLPNFALYADGTVLTPGPQIEIYPPPALPSVEVKRITRTGITRIVAAALDAGLGHDRTYRLSTVQDAPATVFTLVAGGKRHVTSVYGLDETSPPARMTKRELEARRRLLSFRDKVFALERWLPGAVIEKAAPYAFRALAVHVSPVAPTPQPGLRQRPLEWPLRRPLATFGRIDEGARRCGVVSGAALQRVLPLVERANELTPWRSAGRSYSLYLRPLLPGENSCAEV